MSQPFVGVDWGTSSFRAWLFDERGAAADEVRAPDGLLGVGERGFGAVLEAHLATLGAPAGMPALLCGMVGSRTGWREADYIDVPVRLDDLGRRATPIGHEPRPVFVLPGLAQRSATRPDVMRGEETQLLGVVAEGHRTGLVCMPGTHSKWVRLADGAVEGFSTFMTGELFALLRDRSILAKAMEGAGPVDPAGEAFREGVRRSLAEPALATGRLFALRAGWLLDGHGADRQLAALSGLAIGLELAGALACWGDLSGTALLASGTAADLYDAALEVAGVCGVRRLDADACVRHGLRSAAAALF